MASPRIHAIVPAAGEGLRLGSGAGTPKQYRPLLGKPMVQWTVERLARHPAVAGVTVALAPGDATFGALPLAGGERVTTVTGGGTRAESVLRALVRAQELGAEWALVHDAARPCLGAEELDRLIDAGLESAHGAILALPVSDTLKRSDGGEPPRITGTRDRSGLWAAQTPQLFPAGALRTALEAALEAGGAPTDEAGAMEAQGFAPLLVTGATTNIKVTWPGDLAVAEALLQRGEMNP